MRFAMLTMGVSCLAVAMMVAQAEAKARKLDASTHSGTFVSAAMGKMTMLGADGKEHSHTVAKNVKVTVNGKSGTLAEIKKGTAISVTTDKTGAVTAVTTSPVKPATTPKAVAPKATTPPATPTKSPSK
jgi:hypothetical protein